MPGDNGQRTEQPSQRRLDKAREQGQFPASRELVAAAVFLAFVWMLGAWGAEWWEGFRQAARALLAGAFRTEWTAGEVARQARRLGWAALGPFALLGGALLAAALAAQLASTRLGIATKKLAPDLTRLNPLPRLRQLPSQNVPAFFQALVLVPLFCWAVWVVAKENFAAYMAIPLGPVERGAAVVADSVRDLLWKAAWLFLLVGLFDYVRQRRRWMSQMRMTKQEVRDEFKEVEGNPLIKMRIRRLQRDALRKRMMQEVPQASAVVVNPTHYAVALRYRVEDMAAPKVVAKGKNYLARRIRELAAEHGVPVVENPPLARALYKSADVGQEIPPALYQAVAEILAYIYRLSNGRLPG